MNSDVLDWNELLERVQNDQELAFELFEIYTQDFEEKRPLLGGAVINKNPDEVKGIAHSLKGSSGNISAKKLRMIFAELEKQGETKQLDGASNLLKEMDTQYEALKEAIGQLKSGQSD